ncbi:helix-turn-helix transcriptional regulator [Actinoallomurus purpureus]|uniref:helix-turn-helix domain-containing protein n=1 Tax=Actinoallomurus purpureus TaxID=478114 RepID=UPI002092DA7B|nr:helix-turn-helix transcriptional regulator [Actinoallomurus purpureus]MCO6007546.1 helix-turn-helix transcriptional regulator [Actinoallomurus purpureus]
MTPRAFVAKELRRAREQMGMTQAALAKAIFASDSLVAAWESGRRVPKPKYVAPLVEILGIDAILARMISELVTSDAPEWLGRLLELEGRSSSLSTYQPLLVPGLLQTEDYAREVLHRSGRHYPDVDELIQARLERQSILTTDNPPLLVAIMDESVLRRPVGGPGVMREQLAHLIEVADRPDAVIQIVPSDVGAYPGLAGGFLILGFDGREAVYVDDAFSGDIIDAVDDIATMKRVWEALRVEALPGKQSVDLLAEVAKQ